MTDSNDIAAPKGKRARGKNTPQAAPLSGDEQRVLSRGIAFLMFCAAAISFPTIYGLARLIGFDYRLAYLLPAAIDGYAVTSIWFGRRVHIAHPAARAARRNSRLALAITIGCNALYHLLTLGGDLIPAWARITLLVAVSSLPPFLVDRLLHLRSLAAGNSAPAVTATDQPPIVQPKAQPSKNGLRAQSPKSDAVVHGEGQSSAVMDECVVHDSSALVDHEDGSTNAQSPIRSSAELVATASMDDPDELIVQIGKAVYESVKREFGKRPPQSAYRAALADACAPHVVAGRLSKTYADPSLSTAKRVRDSVEERFPELSPLHLIREAS